ncbi:hypothetical protein ACVZYT_002291 [Yersinia enterocolitica]|uniref:hypothetical protein n=1 Tax=Yersinia enterocolitica TaxID=630 RepID=UPI00330D710B|nr:hypothetical protein [Yersinia enterocolitica]
MKTGYAVRKDGLGWRAVDEQSWCTKDETFQIDIPPLPKDEENIEQRAIPK